MSAPAPVNALSVDVEEYFQVSAFEGVIERDRWDGIESRVALGVRRLLDLFESRNVKATFFVLGCVAERHPELIAEIADRNHEVASHGYEHRLVTSFDAESFRSDLRRAAEAIEAVVSTPVRGFRAPSFSISRSVPWAHDVLSEEGYAYSSSVFPVRHDRYGIPDFPRHPVVLTGPEGRRIWEFPMTTWRVCGRNLPAAGGGWLRAWPTWVNRRAIRAANRAGWPAIVYVHPWELDPDQPRVEGTSRRIRFRHRLNLRHTEARLDSLLRRFPFGTVAEVLRSLPESQPAPTG